jgi:hypothetical protein
MPSSSKSQVPRPQNRPRNPRGLIALRLPTRSSATGSRALSARTIARLGSSAPLLAQPPHAGRGWRRYSDIEALSTRAAAVAAPTLQTHP